MPESVYNQNVNRIEVAILDYLDLNKYFFEPQKMLAMRIGYSRQRTNMAIKSLQRKNLIVVLKSKNINRQIKMITLSANWGKGGND